MRLAGMIHRIRHHGADRISSDVGNEHDLRHHGSHRDRHGRWVKILERPAGTFPRRLEPAITVAYLFQANLLSLISIGDLKMAQPIVRNIEEVFVRLLRIRAADHGRSAEAEHREILREALEPGGDPRPFVKP